MDSPPTPFDDVDGPPASLHSWTTVISTSRLVAFLGLFIVVWIVLEDAVAMRFNNFMTGGAIALAGSAAAAVDIAWYAPNATAINDLTGALNGDGVYGFVYNSSYPKGVAYGTYNWCNMPHVRKEEYKKPSKDYKLKYVEVVSFLFRGRIYMRKTLWVGLIVYCAASQTS